MLHRVYASPDHVYASPDHVYARLHHVYASLDQFTPRLCAYGIHGKGVDPNQNGGYARSPWNMLTSGVSNANCNSDSEVRVVMAPVVCSSGSM